ncbi:MAG: hypoxanthine phosphoribosyltransferase [Planctomycetaceae bacterium]|nr:hypoxanthine phosphoribosyltransferase [Planctomycetaceae bacterium]
MPVRELISAAEIERAVTDLGKRVSLDYADQPLTVLGVLSGSIMLVADLMRRVTVPHKLGLVQASSYRGTATSPGELSLHLEGLPDLTDRDILLVDDILDTGRTLAALMESLRQRQPRSIRSAVLLWKKERSQVDLTPDYHCFDIPDEFVVGYGLDYNDEYRHLPFIGVLEN